MKRIFGKQAAANFGKGIFKLIALGSVMSVILWPERHRLESMLQFDPAAIMATITGLTMRLLGAVVAMLAAVAIADYFFQYRQWFERQKMSLQEMKQEFKQSEGDPHIKGRIAAVAAGAHEEAHDDRGSQGVRDHHQPDPLRGGAVL